MPICNGCNNFPADAGDFGVCGVTGQEVHWQFSCPKWVARGYTITADKITANTVASNDKPPLPAIHVGQVLMCAACGSLDLTAVACRKCGRKWKMP